MFKVFFPDDYITSVYDVDFGALFSDGYRVVMFDVDNTLVPHNAPCDKRSIDFFNLLNSLGYKTVMISNNGESRVKTFCEGVSGDAYLYKAGKPKPTAYLKALSMFDVDRNQAIFCGDQIFTDILGAKNAGIRTIMVKPVLKWHEEPQIILKRFLEAIVLFFYGRYVNRNGANMPVPLKEREE